ncbi:MAG TPA: DUF2933 domain-containing protein [Fibrobacteria bacterium]|nr:DUF2933 domain-containing protein [Fibrobacteria bacterium]
MDNERTNRNSWGVPWWIVCAGFLAIALIMNWQEHKAHILGALPYLFLLACPLMHFFMHSGHDHDHSQHDHSHSGPQR